MSGRQTKPGPDENTDSDFSEGGGIHDTSDELTIGSAMAPRVMVVDDDLVITTLVTRLLSHKGYDVVSTNDPAAALKLALECRVDAAVLDVMMPGLSGFDLLGQLRTDPRTASIPVLFLTALDSSKDRIRGLREGADDYLVKPFEAEELELRLQNMLAGRVQSRMSLRMIDDHIKRNLPLKGINLGRYELEHVLGQGAMGLVFCAWDPKLMRMVALKTIRIDEKLTRGKRGDRVNRLLSEARVAAQLSHPNVVAIYDVHDEPGAAFFAMEFVDGMSLEKYLYQNRMPPIEQVLSMSLGTARGLEAAHGRGLVHRDIKPGNILLGSDGTIKVTDFGVANLMTALAEDKNRIFGTPGYVPPEVLRGKPFGPAGDLFSLGVVMYRCLAGGRPFRSSSIRKTCMQTVKMNPPRVRTLTKDVPQDVEDLVHGLLEKNPLSRPSSAQEVVMILEAMVPANRSSSFDESFSGSVEDIPAELPSRWIDTLTERTKITRILR